MKFISKISHYVVVALLVSASFGLKAMVDANRAQATAIFKNTLATHPIAETRADHVNAIRQWSQAAQAVFDITPANQANAAQITNQADQLLTALIKKYANEQSTLIKMINGFLTRHIAELQKAGGTNFQSQVAAFTGIQNNLNTKGLTALYFNPANAGK